MMHTRRVLGVAAATATVTGLLLPTRAAVAATDCVFNDDSTAKISSLQGNCTLDSTLQVPDGWTIDGNGHTMTATGPFTGQAVIASAHGTATPTFMAVGHLTIASVPNGVDGILFDGAEGRVTDVTVQGGENGVEASNSAGAQVKVGRSTIGDYHHAGVYAHGDLKLDVLQAHIGSPAAGGSSFAGVWMENGVHGSVKDSHIKLGDVEPTPTENAFGAGVRIEKDDSVFPRRVEVKRNVFTGGDADFGISVSNLFPTKILTADTNCNLFRRHDTSAHDPYGVGVAQWQNSPKTNLLVGNSTFQGWNRNTGTVSGTTVTAGPPNTLDPSTSTCKPGAPRQVHATGGDHRIKVTWRKAKAPDYAPLTGYRVRATVKGHVVATKKVGPKATSAVLKKLKNNRSYVVTVTAISNGGKASATDRVHL